MRRIVVVGTSGSGKSTLAETLARRFGYPFVELDGLFWGPNWTPVPDEQFQAHVEQAISGDTWVINGNYSRVRDLIWQRADTLIWLDYSLWVCWSRVFRRSIKRIITREELWGTGNRESWRNLFFSKNSLLLWVLQTHGRRRRDYPELLKQPEYAHLNVMRLKSPREAEGWVSRLANK